MLNIIICQIVNTLAAETIELALLRIRATGAMHKSESDRAERASLARRK